MPQSRKPPKKKNYSKYDNSGEKHKITRQVLGRPVCDRGAIPEDEKL